MQWWSHGPTACLLVRNLSKQIFFARAFKVQSQLVWAHTLAPSLQQEQASRRQCMFFCAAAPMISARGHHEPTLTRVSNKSAQESAFFRGLFYLFYFYCVEMREWMVCHVKWSTSLPHASQALLIKSHFTVSFCIWLFMYASITDLWSLACRDCGYGVLLHAILSVAVWKDSQCIVSPIFSWLGTGWEMTKKHLAKKSRH